MTEVCAAVTSRVLEALERGTVPWRKPWHSDPGLPANALTSKPYRGVNVLLLSMSRFRDNRWVTFRQALELGGNVARGERSTEVVFWKPAESQPAEDGEEQARRFPLLRTYKVFNVEQCVGLRLSPLRRDLVDRKTERIARAENVARYMPDPPRIVTGEHGAWYAPASDVVGLPPFEAFRSADAFYATLFHELAHSTGHARRLNRPGVTSDASFGSEAYSREELVAELASAFTCCLVGLDNSLVEDSASYIAGWVRALRDDPKAILIASGQAQRASEWLFGLASTIAE